MIFFFPAAYHNIKNCSLFKIGGKMFFAKKSNMLVMVDIDGVGEMTTIQVDSLNTPRGILAVNGWLVWIEMNRKRIGRFSLRGGSDKVVYQDIGEVADSPRALAFIPN